MDVLFTILVILIVFAGIMWLAGYFELAPQPKKIMLAVLAAIGILFLLGVLFGKVPLIHFGW